VTAKPVLNTTAAKKEEEAEHRHQSDGFEGGDERPDEIVDDRESEAHLGPIEGGGGA